MALGHLNAGIRCPKVTHNTSDKATLRKSSGARWAPARTPPAEPTTRCAELQGCVRRLPLDHQRARNSPSFAPSGACAVPGPCGCGAGLRAPDDDPNVIPPPTATVGRRQVLGGLLDEYHTMSPRLSHPPQERPDRQLDRNSTPLKCAMAHGLRRAAEHVGRPVQHGQAVSSKALSAEGERPIRTPRTRPGPRGRRWQVVRMVPSRRGLEWVIVSFRCRVGCARCRCPGRWSGPGLRCKRLPVPGR